MLVFGLLGSGRVQTFGVGTEIRGSGIGRKRELIAKLLGAELHQLVGIPCNGCHAKSISVGCPKKLSNMRGIKFTD